MVRRSGYDVHVDTARQSQIMSILIQYKKAKITGEWRFEIQAVLWWTWLEIHQAYMSVRYDEHM